MEELHGRVLGTIGAYGMGDSIDPPEAVPQDRPATPPPEPVRVPDVSHISDGVVARRALGMETTASRDV